MNGVEWPLLGMSTSEGLGSGTIFFAFLILTALACASFGFWAWKRIGHWRIKRQGLPKGVQNLFLKVDYRMGQHLDDLRRGYLRALTTDRASIVAQDRHLAEGANLDLVFSPSGAERDETVVAGRVVRKKSLGGSPESWLVDIRFTERSEPAAAVIKDYLQRSMENNP